jgi:hypothetical protein
MHVGIDTLIINARFAIPNDHNCTARAMITSVDSAIIDSVLLCDDGNHADRQAGDGLFGCFVAPQSTENEFIIAVKTVDLDAACDYITENAERFTTIGPVILDRYTITSSDTIPNPGNRLKFQFTLKNEGVAATAKNITTNLISLDTCASPVGSVIPEYGDIAPGKTAPGNTTQYILFSKNSPTSVSACFRLDIASNGYTFWSDTFSVFIYPTSVHEENGNQKIPKEFVLYQNYPNPFNPTTTISYALAKHSHVRLTIYNALGQVVVVLVDGYQAKGYYNVKWDTHHQPSGIYLSQLKAGGFSAARKMFLQK